MEDDRVDIETAAFGGDSDLEALAGFAVVIAEERVGALDDGIGADGDAHFRDLAGARTVDFGGGEFHVERDHPQRGHAGHREDSDQPEHRHERGAARTAGADKWRNHCWGI